MDNNDSGGSTKTACYQGGDMETDSNAIDRYRVEEQEQATLGQWTDMAATRSGGGEQSRISSRVTL